MHSSLLLLVTKHPELLANHAQGYLALAREAWAKQIDIYRLKIVWSVLALACFVVAAVHAGMLVVLYFVLDPDQQSSVVQTLWVPLVSLVGGGICLALGVRQVTSDPFGAWNEQIAADMALLRAESSLQ